jgi:hypothetical protein
VDVIFSHDVGKISLKNTRLAVLLTPYYMTNEDLLLLKREINQDGKLLFVGKTQIDTAGELAVQEETQYQTLRRMIEEVGVSCLAPENCAVYADSRVVSFFPREDMSFVPQLPKEKRISDFLSGEQYEEGTEISIRAALGRAFVIEE